MEGWNGIFPGIFQLWEDPSRLKRDRWGGGVHPRLEGASLNIPHCGQALAPPLRSASSGLPLPWAPTPFPVLQLHHHNQGVALPPLQPAPLGAL